MNGTLTGATAPGQSKPDSNGNERLLHIRKTLRLELHHQKQFSVTTRTQE